ncbi:MAG: murein biosynthesis integral membrane protein MurJ [Planctomycetota bacterium]
MSTKGMIRSTWGVGALTLLSRLLGLVRDKGLVLVFGASPGVLDAFLLAFTIPNLFRRLFGEGALSSAFIPAFIDVRENRSAEEGNRLASAVATGLFLLLSGLTLLGIALCFLGWTAAGEGSRHALPLRLTAVMLPFLVFICLSALGSGMLQGVRSFALPAAMPVSLNVMLLAALAYIHWRAGGAPLASSVFYVAFAVVAAGLFQVLLQAAALRGHGVRLRFLPAFGDEGLMRVFRAMGPTVVGLAVFQVNVLVDRLIAYLLIPGTGALTHLYLGNRLMQFPLALFGIALATTAFPEIVSHTTRKEWDALFQKIATGVRFLAFVMLPASFGLMVLAGPVVRMIFQEPDLVFSDAAVYQSALVLACYAPGLFFIGLQLLFVRIFYARGDYKTPVRVTAAMVVMNLLLNLLLIRAPDLYRRWALGETAARLGEGGLALSTSIVSLLTAGWMWRLVRREVRERKVREAWERAFRPVFASVARILVAALASGYFTYRVVLSIPREPELLMRLERGLVPVAAGVLAYVIFCYIFEVPEVEEFLWGKKPLKKE